MLLFDCEALGAMMGRLHQDLAALSRPDWLRGMMTW
jgi:hypothetical protein